MGCNGKSSLEGFYGYEMDVWSIWKIRSFTVLKFITACTEAFFVVS